MAIQAYVSGIGEHPMPSFDLSSGLEQGDMLYWDDLRQAFVNGRALVDGDTGAALVVNAADVVNALGYTPLRPEEKFSGDYDDLINKPFIPDLTGYATKTWVSTQVALGVSNNIPDLFNYYTKEEVDAMVGGTVSISMQDVTNYTHPPAITEDPTVDNYWLMEYDVASDNYTLRDFSTIFATREYVDIVVDAISGVENLLSWENIQDQPFIPTDVSDLADATGLLEHGTFENFTQIKVSTVNIEAIKSEFVLAVRTTNNIETEVLKPDSTRIDIAENTTAMFKVTAVATNGTHSMGQVLRGVIHNFAGPAALVGDVMYDILEENGGDWLVEARASANGLSLYVKGGLETIDWTLFVELSEVRR